MRHHRATVSLQKLAVSTISLGVRWNMSAASTAQLHSLLRAGLDVTEGDAHQLYFGGKLASGKQGQGAMTFRWKWVCRAASSLSS